MNIFPPIGWKPSYKEIIPPVHPSLTLSKMSSSPFSLSLTPSYSVFNLSLSLRPFSLPRSVFEV